MKGSPRSAFAALHFFVIPPAVIPWKALVASLRGKLPYRPVAAAAIGRPARRAQLKPLTEALTEAISLATPREFLQDPRISLWMCG